MKKVWTDSHGTIHKPVPGSRLVCFSRPVSALFARIRHVRCLRQDSASSLIADQDFQF